MTAFLLAVLALGPYMADTSGSGGPLYTADSIANTASNIAGFYAPNTFVTIYGTNLAYGTRALTSDDIQAGMLPPTLGNVVVLINGSPADMYYVSATQVNLLIPTQLVAGPAIVQLVRDGFAGPAIAITLSAAAPSMFQINLTTVVATHLDYTLITAASPAHGGEEIVLYATGLGATIPSAIPNQIPETSAILAVMSDFQVLLNGVPVDPRRIDYAGVTPGYAGLYQINLRLPDDAPPNPEIRVGNGAVLSPKLRYLPVQ